MICVLPLVVINDDSHGDIICKSLMLFLTNFAHIYVKTTKTSQQLSDYCDVPSSSAASCSCPCCSCSLSSSSSVSRMSSLTWKASLCAAKLWLNCSQKLYVWVRASYS